MEKDNRTIAQRIVISNDSFDKTLIEKLRTVKDSEFVSLKETFKEKIKDSKYWIEIAGVMMIIPLILEIPFFIVSIVFRNFKEDTRMGIRISYGIFITISVMAAIPILGFIGIILYHLGKILNARKGIRILEGDGVLKMVNIVEEETQQKKDYEQKIKYKSEFWNRWERYNYPKEDLDLPNDGFDTYTENNYTRKCSRGKIIPKINRQTFEIEEFIIKFDLTIWNSSSFEGRTIGIVLSNEYNLQYIFYEDGSSKKNFNLNNNENTNIPKVVKNLIDYLNSSVMEKYDHTICIDNNRKNLSYNNGRENSKLPITFDMKEQSPIFKRAVDFLRSALVNLNIIPEPIKWTEETPKLNQDGTQMTKLEFIQEEVKKHVPNMKSSIEREKARYEVPIEEPDHKFELHLEFKKPRVILSFKSCMKHTVKVPRLNSATEENIIRN